MNCADFQSILADYLDGTLSSAESAAVELHLAGCGSCREFMSDVTAGMALLNRVPEVSAPAELITRIAYQAPLGKIRDAIGPESWFRRFSNRWLSPVLQPRLAMGMAMTVLSFAMLERCTGIHAQHIQAADLNPVRVWNGTEDKALRVKDRAVKYYENLRVVYELETRLRDLQEQQDSAEQSAQKAKQAVPKTQGRSGNLANGPNKGKTQ